jgi:tape measure domain-containing protein
MATDLERLVVSLDADIRKFDRSLKNAVATFNGETRKIEMRAKTMQRNVQSSFAGLGKGLALGVGVAGVTSAIMAFKELSDAATRTQNSLKVAGLSGAELTNVYEQLFAAAQRNAVPIEELARLYGRATLSQKDLGASTARMIQFTDNVAKALRVSGSSAESARGALLQLSQALSGGVVRAEEFNSIQEGALPILQAVAAGYEKTGGSVANLRKIMLAGQLTSKDFFDAFERGAKLLDKQLAGSVLTIDQALVKLQNSLQDSVGRIDSVLGISAKTVEIIGRLSQAIDSLGQAFTLVSGTPMGQFIGQINTLQSKLNPLYNAIGALEGAINSLPGAIRNSQLAAAEDDIVVIKDALTEMFDTIADAPDSWVSPRIKSELAAIKKLIDDNAISAEEAKKRVAELANGSSVKGAESSGNSFVAQQTERFGEFIDVIGLTTKKVQELKKEIEETMLDNIDIGGNAPVPDSILQAQEDMKRNDFFNQRNAEAMKTDLEKNVDTRAKAIIEAAAKVGVALTDAAAKIQARSELSAEAATARTGRVSSDVTELIKGFEDFRSTPYWDVNAYRVGYGSDTITLADGTIQKVTKGISISVEDANRDLTRRIGDFQEGIRGQIGGGTFDAMNDSQQAALTSIAYNYGSLPQRIVDAIRSGSTETVYNAIKGLGTDNAGINAGRRAQEAELFLTGAAPGVKTSIDSKESFAEKIAEQQRMLQQLKEETGIRATLNPLISDYGRKLSELEKAQELFNLAQQEGTAAGKELTSATQLLNGDLSALTPEARAQAEAMRALATQYGVTAAAAEQLKTSQEAAAKSSTESLELAKSVTGGILSDIRSALSDGKITWKEWGEIAVNALNKVADKLQEMLLNQLFSPTSGAGGFLGLLTGGGGFTPNTTLGGFLGAFNKGGYTGDGGKNQPAGIVHKGEYVFDADSVQRLGIRNLQALQGYANGGLVGGMPRLPNVAGAGGQEVHVYVDDEGGLRAYVQREGRKTEARIATTTRGTFDNYRKNDLHNDINNHTRNSRRRG